MSRLRAKEDGLRPGDAVLPGDAPFHGWSFSKEVGGAKCHVS